MKRFLAVLIALATLALTWCGAIQYAMTHCEVYVTYDDSRAYIQFDGYVWEHAFE